MKVVEFNPAPVPQVLRDIKSWLLWKLVKSKKADGTVTWLKVPYWSDGWKRRGALGTKEDRKRLTTFNRALEVYKKGGYAGLGFAPMPDFHLTILDLDKCIAGGQMSEFAQQVVKSGTYVERSPSGTGLRAVFTGESVIQGKANGHIENGERVEIYCGSAYVTITGDVINAVEAKALSKGMRRALQPVIDGGWSGTGSPTEEGLMHPDSGPVPDFTVDHARVVLSKLPEVWGQPGHGTWYRVAAALHLQFDGSEEAYQLLDEWSQGIDGYDQENNAKRWASGFSHKHGRDGLTTMRNLVFESIQNGGLKVRPDTMKKWGLSRQVDEDFVAEDEVVEAVLPEYDELDRMADIGRMVHEDAPPVDWLVEDIIPRGNVTFLAGGSGTSKSYWTMQLLGSAAVGIEEFAGLKITAQGFRTCYLAYEDTLAVLHTRIQEVTKYLGDRVDILGDGEYKELLRTNLLMLPAEVLDSGAWALAKAKKRFEPMEITPLAQYLRDYVSSRGIDLLVFDTGSEIHTGDENSAADMVVLMRALRQLATVAGIGVLVIQHVQKGIWQMRLADVNQSSIRGSSVLVDKSRNVVMLARMPRQDAPSFGLPADATTHENYVVLKHVKANLGGYVGMRVFERTSRGLLIYREELQQNENTPIVADEIVEEQQGARTAAKHARQRVQILEYIREQNAENITPSTTMVRMNSGVPDNQARMLLAVLEEEGALEKSINPDHPRSSNWRVVLT